MNTELILMLMLLAIAAGLENRLRRTTRNLREARTALLRSIIER